MKRIIETMEKELFDLAKTMCNQYCKYGEQFEKDQQDYDDENPTYIQHCSKCPMIQFYA